MIKFCLDQTPFLKIALVYEHQSKQIMDIAVENRFKPSLNGTIFSGKVVQIADGFGGAFVDIGLKENAFIKRTQLLRGLGLSPSKHENTPLSKLVKNGQMVIAQVDKEPYQTKGAQLTTDISLPGKTIILMPNMRGVRISKKAIKTPHIIAIETQLKSLLGNDYGAIIRSAVTTGEISVEEVLSDAQSLINLWEQLKSRATLGSSIMKLHETASFESVVEEMLLRHTIDQFHVSSKEEMRFLTDLGIEKRHISAKAPVTAHFIEQGVPLDKWLFEAQKTTPEGVKVTIDELEAFTICDVNSGTYDMSSDARNAIFYVNASAAQAILSHIRLHRLSGILLIDFIDMTAEEQLSFIQHLLLNGYDKGNGFTIEGFTKLGILELSRKRDGGSLRDLLSLEYAKKDYAFWVLNDLWFDLKRLCEHTNATQVEVEVDERLYGFLRQTNPFAQLPIKIKFSLLKRHEKNYRLITSKH